MLLPSHQALKLLCDELWVEVAHPLPVSETSVLGGWCAGDEFTAGPFAAAPRGWGRTLPDGAGASFQSKQLEETQVAGPWVLWGTTAFH